VSRHILVGAEWGSRAMAAALADAKVTQANFLKVIGAVVPNARIDFQHSAQEDCAATESPEAVNEMIRVLLPNLSHTPKTALPGVGDAVTSDCCTPRTSDRTPASGTPEWTPRCADCASQGLSPESATEPAQSESCGSVGLEMAPLAPPEQLTWQSPVWNGDVEVYSWYRVAYLGGIELRIQPNFLAARSGVVLIQNEVFSVSSEIVGADGRVYLLLADGRGWAFDDSALMPHDPSVIRGHFAYNHAIQSGAALPLSAHGCGPADADGAAFAQAGMTLLPPVLPAFVATPSPSASHYCYPDLIQPHMIDAAHIPLSWSPMSQEYPFPLEQATPSLSYPSSLEQAGSVFPQNCLPAVTSDCPPMWEPMVGLAAGEQGH